MNENGRKRFPVWLVFLIIGIVLLVAGIIAASIVGIDRYSNYESENINETFDGTNIDRIFVDLKVGDVNIVSYSGNEFKVEAEEVPKDKLIINSTNSTFSIRYKQFKWYEWYKHINLSWNGITAFNFDNAEITIYVPEKIYNNFEFDSGVGDFSISGIKFINGDFDLGVGEGTFSNLVSTGSVEFDMGVGTNTFNNCEFADADISLGVGEVEFNGKITKSLDVDSGTGSCLINIDGNYYDYKVRYDGGIGNTTIDEGTLTQAEASGLRIPIEVDSGVGDITIRFK